MDLATLGFGVLGVLGMLVAFMVGHALGYKLGYEVGRSGTVNENDTVDKDALV